MHRFAPLALVLWLASGLLPSARAIQSWSGQASFSPPALQAQAAVPAKPASSKIWIGRHEEFEKFLREAPFQKGAAETTVGVTKPLHILFPPGGLAGGAIVKVLPPGRHGGFWDSYRSEIAAYELDKLLEMDMVPPTVERRAPSSDLASVQLWVENTVWLKTLREKKQQSPDIYGWNRQVYRQRVWDNLVANVDRNEGNLLVDPAWNLILIDHSRAFVPETPSVDRMWFPARVMTHIDEQFYAKLKALDEAALQEHLGKWVAGSVKPILKRRDAIVDHFEKLIKEKGKDEVIIM